MFLVAASAVGKASAVGSACITLHYSGLLFTFGTALHYAALHCAALRLDMTMPTAAGTMRAAVVGSLEAARLLPHYCTIENPEKSGEGTFPKLSRSRLALSMPVAAAPLPSGVTVGGKLFGATAVRPVPVLPHPTERTAHQFRSLR